jgi:hypothetical protein
MSDECSETKFTHITLGKLYSLADLESYNSFDTTKDSDTFPESDDLTKIREYTKSMHRLSDIDAYELFTILNDTILQYLIVDLLVLHTQNDVLHNTIDNIITEYKNRFVFDDLKIYRDVVGFGCTANIAFIAPTVQNVYTAFKTVQCCILEFNARQQLVVIQTMIHLFSKISIYISSGLRIFIIGENKIHLDTPNKERRLFDLIESAKTHDIYEEDGSMHFDLFDTDSYLPVDSAFHWWWILYDIHKLIVMYLNEVSFSGNMQQIAFEAQWNRMFKLRQSADNPNILHILGVPV